MGSVADQPSRVHRSPAVRRRPAVSGPPATPQDVSGLTVSGVLARHRPTELCSAGRAPQSLLGGPLVVRRASLPRGSRRCLQTRGGGRPRASWTWSGEVDTISRVKAIYRVGQIVLLTGEMAVMRSWIRPLLAGTVLVAASCTASQHESPPSLGEIRIGLLAPLSGEAKAAGTDAVHGAQLAAAMLNGEDGTQLRETRIGVPGLQGSAVRIIPADTRNKPDPAVVSTLGQRAAAGGATKRIGILYADDAPSNAFAAATAALASEGGYQVVPQGPAGFASGPGKDPGAAVQQVRAARPDAVVLVANAPVDAQKIVRAFAAPGFLPAGIFTLGAGFRQPPALQAFAQSGAGLLGGTSWSREAAIRDPAAKVIVSFYEERYYARMSDVAAGSFTAVLTLATAIDRAHSLDAERVRAALLSLDVPGRSTIMPWNGVRFDATTH